MLSTLPQSVLPFVPPSSIPALRPRPQFNVGIHDLPYLSSLSPPSTSNPDSCWIASTTDRVLGYKAELYDILVTLPPPYSSQAQEKIYPKITYSSKYFKSQKAAESEPLKATQRDARRFLNLRNYLRDIHPDSTSLPDQEEDSDSSSTFSSSAVVEPISWPLLAYSSFIWWASAGEKGAGPSDEESEQDSRLLLTDHYDGPNPGYPLGSARQSSITPRDKTHQPSEIILITYFRRLTTQIFTVLSDIIARYDDIEYGDEENEEDENVSESGTEREPDDDDDPTIQDYSTAHTARDDDHQPLLNSFPHQPGHRTSNDDKEIIISSTDMSAMGLDIWSTADRTFAEEMVNLWWGRKAQVQGARIKCCGVQIL